MIYSIFNDVLGPVIYGPSSSHSAAPCRIGYLCQQLLQGTLKKAVVYFDPESSYASTYRFHCSDRGFVAGLLGIAVDQEENLQAFSIARERHTDITFQIEAQENKHPNYARIELFSENDHIEIGTLSTGGGMLELVSLDGFPVKVTGDRWVYFVKNPVTLPDLSHKIVTCGNDRLLIVEQFTDQSPHLPAGDWLRNCAPILPVPARETYDMPFTTYKEAVAYGEQHHLSAGELGIRYEMARSGKDRPTILAMMKRIMDVMHQSVIDSTHRAGGKAGGCHPYKATEMAGQLSRLPDVMSVIGRVSTNAAAVFEHTLSVGLVTAAPTGGSCGVIPAAVVELGFDMQLSEEMILRGMFAAGLVGIFISNDATFGCEVAGCQAENGSGSAMAAAGLAEMLDAPLDQAFAAAALAMQNTLGLVCDPIGCAYVPCVGRNAMAATNAISAASMVVSGYRVYIPLDETIQTMMAIGQNMPACHRCTGGGLNLTPSGEAINESTRKYIDSL